MLFSVAKLCSCMKPKPSLLLHPLLIISLLLLLANDHWFKHSYHNWLTGKLSDFTGVFVFAVFFMAILPVKRMVVLVATAILFYWFKSPLSTPCISWVNNTLHLEWTRVVDYTDLVALLTLPLAYYIQPVDLHVRVWPVLKPLIGTTTILAMMATSRYNRFPDRLTYHHEAGKVYVYEDFKTRLTEKQFIQKLDSLQIPYRYDTIEYLAVRTDDFYYKVQPGNDTTVLWQPIKDSSLYRMFKKPPYYTIPMLVFDKDTIRDLRFHIYDFNKNKRLISIESMVLPEKMVLDYNTLRKVRKKYYAIYKSLLIE